jgi:hypothetical protein
MKIYLVGNQLLSTDSLPLLIKPNLQKIFPQFEFIEADPCENLIPENDSFIIDTVVGLTTIKVFDSLDDFVSHKLVSVHDYDLGFHLQLLYKLNKIKQVKIIGIPAEYSLSQANQGIVEILKQCA